jgi:hypothetical protein
MADERLREARLQKDDRLRLRFGESAEQAQNQSDRQ